MQLSPPKLYLFVFLISLLGYKFSLSQLGLQDGDSVVLHITLILKSLSYPNQTKAMRVRRDADPRPRSRVTSYDLATARAAAAHSLTARTRRRRARPRPASGWRWRASPPTSPGPPPAAGSSCSGQQPRPRPATSNMLTQHTMCRVGVNNYANTRQTVLVSRKHIHWNFRFFLLTPALLSAHLRLLLGSFSKI